jgi:Mg-chelatase subunit ChlD
VLMTDGEMTGRDGYWSQKIDSKVRAACDKARTDGITIYTVGFMAPSGGRELLQYCATSKMDYYEADTAAGLVAAFSNIAENISKPLDTTLTR